MTNRVNNNVQFVQDDAGNLVGYQHHDKSITYFPRVLGQGASGFSVVAVAATFVAAVAADSVATPGKVQLTSAGVHGLTTGVGLAGAHVQVDWAYNPGNPVFYPLVSVDSTKIITIDLASNEAALSWGLATVTPLANTFTAGSVAVPAGILGANGVLTASTQWTAANSGNIKRVGVSFGSLSETTGLLFEHEREVTNLALGAAGTGYAVADVITLAGGIFETAGTVTVNTIKVVSAAVNAPGTGYVVGDALTLVGGTHTAAATATVTHTQLITVGSATAGGSGYAVNDVITVAAVGGTMAAAAHLTVATVKLASAAVNAAGTGYHPADVITLAGGTFTTAADVTVATTKAVSATVAAGGTGNLGVGAGVIVEGTTGTGTKFRASVTIAANAIASVQSISTAGAYTVNPTLITAEPVTYISGASSGSTLTGAQLSVVMGVGTITVSNPGAYTTSDATHTQDTVAPSGGTGATFNTCLYGARTATVTTPGDFTANSTSFTQASASPANGTGATFASPSYGVLTATIAGGSYTVGTTSFTTTGGTGASATFNTGVFGVNTFTISSPGDYSETAATYTQGSVDPNVGTGATFTSSALVAANKTFTIRNRGSEAVQINSAGTAGAVATTADQTLSLTAYVAAANDVLTLEGYSVQISPSA